MSVYRIAKFPASVFSLYAVLLFITFLCDFFPSLFPFFSYSVYSYTYFRVDETPINNTLLLYEKPLQQILKKKKWYGAEHKWFYIYAKSSPKYCYFSEKIFQKNTCKYATIMYNTKSYRWHFCGLINNVIDLVIYMSLCLGYLILRLNRWLRYDGIYADSGDIIAMCGRYFLLIIHISYCWYRF